MVQLNTSAVYKPLIGVSAIAATMVGVFFLSAPAPSTSNALRTTAIDPLDLYWSVTADGWTQDDGSPSDLKCEIRGDANLDAGSWCTIAGWVTATDGYLQDYPHIGAGGADVLGAPPTDTLASLLPNTYDYSSMPDIEIGATQFMTLTGLAIDDAPLVGTDNNGVHMIMQPMLWPGSGNPGLVDFFKYPRLAPSYESFWDRLWSRVESPRRFFSKRPLAEKLCQRQAAELGVTLDSDYFTSTDPGKWTTACTLGLTIHLQVVSLQGPDITPSTYPTTDDWQSDAVGPPGLRVVASNSIYRTSNQITISLGGSGIGHGTEQLYTKSAYTPQNQVIYTGHPGGATDVALDVYPNSELILSHPGSSNTNVSVTWKEPGVGTVHFPGNLQIGTYSAIASVDSDNGTDYWTGNHVIKFVLTN